MHSAPEGTMAQQQNKQNRPKQPQDPHAQTAKQLTSAVQRLRGWVGSDPSRTPELADALVALTRHRLLGHAYTVAAPDAQESVKLAAQLLTADGPIGPYTSVDDAGRYVTAVVQLAVIQSAAGMVEAAAETVGSLTELREQLGSLPLVAALPPSTVVWALCCTARGALEVGDAAQANAYADAVLARVAESGLREDSAAAYLVMDADRLVSDARWAGGLGSEALTHAQLARETYDLEVDGRLVQAARLSPVLRQRLAEPLYGLYRDLADRLLGTGEIDLGTLTRRRLVELLSAVAPQEESARVQLAASLADLVRDLRAHGRDDEAELVAQELAALPAGDREAATELAGGVTRGQAPIRWESLGDFAAYAGVESGSMDVAVVQGQLRRDVAERLAAERAEAERLAADTREEARLAAERRAAERAEVERLAAEQAEAERRAAERVEAERRAAEQAEAERRAAEEEAERAERKRRREERIEAHRLEQERLEAERLAAEQREAEERAAAERDADPAARERYELERLQAELAELEAAERAAEQEAAAQEIAERRAAELEAARQAAARVAEDERIAAERAEAAQLELERIAETQRAEARAAEERAKAEAWESKRHEEERLEAERAEAAREEAARIEAAQVAAEHVETVPNEVVEDELEPVELPPVEPEPVGPESAQPEPAEAESVEPESAEPESAEPEPAEPESTQPELVQPESDQPEPAAEDELTTTYRAWQAAKSQGDRKTARALNERVVELLRPRTEQDLAEYGPRLLYALEELSSARLRAGELFASRGPAREAKALAKSLGRR